ncbi:MAG: hypothetical protein JXA92_02210 [candidate division Zixibacteria bacterium]|nr:hypothetical protein [candidate division Zixibacteria bacterium]
MKKILLILIIGVAVDITSLANTPHQSIGARPTAMSGAFIGVADDGNALYWNPAGMAFLDHHEITASHIDLFGIGIYNNYIAYTYPITDLMAVGLDWFSLGYEDSELDYNFNKFNFALAYRAYKKLSVGATLKFLNTSTSFDNQTLGKGNGWTGDIGALYKHNEKLSVGLSVYNLFDGWISYDNGVRAKYCSREIQFGLGYRPVKGLLAAVDIGNQLCLGGEYVYQELLPVRIGLKRDLEGEKETNLSFGTGLRYNIFQFDYAYTSYPHLDNSSMFSLSLFFNFGHTLVKAKNIRLVNELGLFPARWNTYQAVPFLEFELQNKTDRPFPCSWQVELEDMLGSQPSGELILRPNENRRVTVTGEFNEKFYSNPSDIFKTGRITIQYAQGRETQKSRNSFQVFIYDKGAINWNESKLCLGGFINPRDPWIRNFTLAILEANHDYIEENKPLTNVHMAMAIMNGLKSYGLKYLPDPNNPYSSIDENKIAIDNIQFPYELLISRQGDCDDLTVLVTTMLESIGIRTVILDVPGHLYLMFDTGIPTNYRISLMLDENLYVSYKGRIYIPLEVTEVTGGFIKAWQTGVEEYRRWSQLHELKTIDLREAWSVYQPVPINQDISRDRFDYSPDLASMDADYTRLTEFKTSFMFNNFNRQITDLTSDPDILNRMAVNEIFNGKFTRGEELLEKAYTTDSTRTGIAVNYANILTINGAFDKAFALYEKLLGAELYKEEMIINTIVSRALAVDSASGEKAVYFRTQFLPVLTRYDLLPIDEQKENILFRCFANNTDGLEVAGCVKTFLINLMTPTRESTTGTQIEGNIFDEKVRLFQWLY